MAEHTSVVKDLSEQVLLGAWLRFLGRRELLENLLEAIFELAPVRCEDLFQDPFVETTC